MKNLALVVLLVTGVIFGSVCLRRGGQINRDQARIDELTETLKAKEAEAEATASAESKVKDLRSRLTATKVDAASKSTQLADLAQKLATAETNAANPMKGLAEMFKSPEMKEMMKTQQKAVIGPMLEKSYAALYKQINLSDDQKATLKDLLEKKMMAASETSMELMGDVTDKAKQAEITKRMKDDGDQYNAQIKQLLGDTNYAQFEAYEKAQPERMQVGQFKDQLGAGATALAGDQEQQLIQAMADERTNFKWTTDFANPSNVAASMADFFSEDKMNQFALEKAQMDQRSLARAQQILTPEQYPAFESFLNAQREMQINSMKLGAKMLAPRTNP